MLHNKNLFATITQNLILYFKLRHVNLTCLLYPLKHRFKKVIFRKGGDYDLNTNVSYPGFAIYHKGMDIHAVMVTNDDVYDLRVRGQLVNNTWTNIAFRFEKYIDTQSLPYLSRGGLEVKVTT